jgi:hypothetical protein
VSRTRVGVGILAVAAGTAWALGGTASLISFARSAVGLVPLALILAGAASILLVAVPRGTLTGPIVLISIGAIGIAVEHGLLRRSWSGHVLPLALIAAGVVVAMSRSEKPRIDTGVERHRAILFPAHPRVSGRARDKFIAHAILGLLRLDLTRADFPTGGRLWIDVTVLLGRFEVVLPTGWEIVAGRIELARGVSFAGRLDSARIASTTDQQDAEGGDLVVLNVQGWGGAVVVQRV